MQWVIYLRITPRYVCISQFHFTAVHFSKRLWPPWAAVRMSGGCPERQCAAVTLGCSQKLCPSIAEHFVPQETWPLHCSYCTAEWLWPFSSHRCRLISLWEWEWVACLGWHQRFLGQVKMLQQFFPIIKSQQSTLNPVAALVANLAVPDFWLSTGCSVLVPYLYFLQLFIPAVWLLNVISLLAFCFWRSM